MYHYAILRNPGHNQVFYQNAAPLALAELALLGGKGLGEIQLRPIAGISYLCFASDTAISQEMLEKIARLSSVFALFALEGELLRPVALPTVQVYDRSLGTILKYQGKTNEIFTRFLLNIALSQGSGGSLAGKKLLDPVAGRGTTLFEGFALGLDVYGVEIQDKAVEEGFAHVKKFLEKGKYKHQSDHRRFSGENKSFSAKKHSITCDKQQFQLVAADSKYVSQIFSPNSFHYLVGDLPYGVQHGNMAGGKTRSPAQLLASCGRAWYTVLKNQGVLVLSWNTLVFSREKMVQSLAFHGFTILEEDLFTSLAHQVDASIHRDVIVAKKIETASN